MDTGDTSMVFVRILKTDSAVNQTNKPYFTAKHLLPASINKKSKPSEIAENDWITGVFLMVFLILAWVRVYHSKRIWHFFRAFLSKLYVGLLLREKDSLTKDASIVLNGLFIIVSSLLLYQLCIEYSWNFLPGSNFYLFMMIFFISLSFYILKTGVLKIFGAILNEKEKSSEYVFTITILNSVLGLLLLPVLVCSTYLNFAHSFLMAVGISLWVIIYIYRLYRGLSIGLRIAKVSQYYIFLYLCTLEILPMVILTRLFLSEL